MVLMEREALPKVSVCIPTYNSARYLPETIESVLRQDFADYELVICDDVSTDETPEICRAYDDPRIRYIRYRENAKQAGNFNRCLQEARGDFVTLLHADDWLLSGFLSDRVNRLTLDPGLGFVFGAVRIADAKSNLISTSGRWADDTYFRPGELLDHLLFGCVVSPPSLMVRKVCTTTAGLFRGDLTWGHDWEWAMRLAEHCAAQYVHEPLAVYRVHDASGTAEQLNAAKNGSQERRILKETLERTSATDNRFNKLRRPAFQALSRRHMYFAEQALFDGRRPVARNNLYYAALADGTMLGRTTFWALLLGSFGPVKLYSKYKQLRNASVASGNEL
jgi:glycosyltransferase involved in cell wall biosynthesis